VKKASKRAGPRKAGKPKKPDLFSELPAVDEEAGEEPDFRMRGLYISLGTVVAAAVVASLIFEGVGWVDRFAPGVATEGIGILLTVVLVQRFLQRQERARRLRGSIGALRKGSRALASIAWTWAELIRGSLRRVPAQPPLTLDALLGGHFTEELGQWEPRAQRRDGDGAEPSGRWAARCFREAQDALNEIIVTYGGSLDPGYIEAIDELVDDPFLRFICDVAGDGTLDGREWRHRLNAARAHREAHFFRLLQAVTIQNDLATEAGRLRSRRSAPRTGAVGLKLDPDHDLKVHLAIDPRWWWAEPAAGPSS
jgi:hypothetical protein